ncbi:hypothetical protein BVY03_04995 [bacterium K02(2017)]|nr:hypothetical protein BVY03_04995 [bacterium K02(2017)]
MLEYTDKNFGKIKLLNVTEARAKFATVLGDHKYNYVITKNNKPLRVIIDYAEYESLKKQADAMVANPSISIKTDTKDGTPPKSVKITTSESQIDKPNKSKSRVQGVLEKNAAQIASSPRKNQKIEKAKIEPEDNEDSYFYGSNQNDQLLNDLPTENTILEDSIVSEPPKEFDSLPVQEIVEQKPVQKPDRPNKHVNTESDANSKTEEKLPVQANEAEESNIKESDKPDLSSKTENMTEEQLEYFQKYKKLYEKMNIPGMSLEDELVNQNESPTSIDRDNVADILAAPAEEEVSKQMMNDQNEGETSPEPSKQTKSENKSLPSLKDLLKDLDNESLSSETEGDDSNLDEQEIDDLINRITQD